MQLNFDEDMLVKVRNQDINHDGSFQIPAGVIQIASQAFYECKNLTQIKLPNEITHIRTDAFMGCRNLTKVRLSHSLTHILAEAFSSCVSLTDIQLPNTLTYLGENAFFDCKNLIQIVLPEKITEIRPETFACCINLAKITLPHTLTNIGRDAFHNCHSLQHIQINSEDPDDFARIIELLPIQLRDRVIPIDITKAINDIQDSAIAKVLRLPETSPLYRFFNNASIPLLIEDCIRINSYLRGDNEYALKLQRQTDRLPTPRTNEELRKYQSEVTKLMTTTLEVAAKTYEEKEAYIDIPPPLPT